MTEADPTLLDQLAEPTDNGPEQGTPDPPQDQYWRPDGAASELEDGS